MPCVLGSPSDDSSWLRWHVSLAVQMYEVLAILTTHITLQTSNEISCYVSTVVYLEMLVHTDHSQACRTRTAGIAPSPLRNARNPRNALPDEK